MIRHPRHLRHPWRSTRQRTSVLVSCALAGALLVAAPASLFLHQSGHGTRAGLRASHASAERVLDVATVTLPSGVRAAGARHTARVPGMWQLLFVVGTVLGGGRWRFSRADATVPAVDDRLADVERERDMWRAMHGAVVEAHEASTATAARLRAVLDALDIGVLVVDAHGTVFDMNAPARALLERAHRTLVGERWDVCLPIIEADRPRIQAGLDASGSGGGREPVQMVLGGRRFRVDVGIGAGTLPDAARLLCLHDATEVSSVPSGMRADDRSRSLVGRSTAMHLVYRQIRDVSRVDATVLIEGETGTGKELVARAIHRGSRRADKPFIAVNAAGLAESILASQLFGHRRGAFTGAVADQAGLFEAANGGTLFLDEIGDIPTSVQVSLLRVLQEREIMRIGDARARRLDVRFLAATHRDLVTQVAEGRFREDLFYRIRVATIRVPALRDRRDDIPLLVDAFLWQIARQSGRAVPAMSRDGMEALMRHTWPGNVRELKSAIERALLETPGDVIRLAHLPPDVVGHAGPSVVARVEAAAGADERSRLVDALRRSGGNRAVAARLLGIGRSTFYRRLALHGLDGSPT